MGITAEEMRDLIENSKHLFDWEAIALVPKLAVTVQKLLAEIRDSEAREADFRNRAEVAESYRAYYETKLEGKISPPDPKAIVIHSDGTVTAPWQGDDENVNPDVYRVEDGHMFEVSPWPSMEGKCHLCGRPETMHMPSGASGAT